MLSRANSDAGTRLRHAKSSSSAYSKGWPPVTSTRVDNIDPFIVREQATTAAVHAYERACAMEHARMREEQRNLELCRHRSNASRRSHGGSQGSHFPARASSLRQAGEASATRRRASPKLRRVSDENLRPPQIVEPPPPRYTLVRDPPPTAPRLSLAPDPRMPISPAPPSRVAPLMPSVPYNSTPATPAPKEVRKSRSMYSSWSLGLGTPRGGRHDASMDLRRSTSQRVLENQPPMKSGLSPESANPNEAGKSSVEDVNTARDKYLQDFHKSRKLKTRPSFILTPFKKRQDKEKHQVLTEAINESTSPPIDAGLQTGSPPDGPAKPEKERSFSNSFRNKFKRVFRKNSNPKAPNLPVQQVRASRSYYGDSFTTSQREVSATTDRVDSMSDRSQVRVPSHERTASGASLSLSHHSSGGGSDNDVSKSRVTSWSNSSAPGSVTSRDPRRLSIIPENGTGSTKKRSGSSILGKSPFRRPLHASPQPGNRELDTFDVYSALKSRLEKAGLDSNLDPDLHHPDKPATSNNERDLLPSQSRMSSTASRLTRATKATIRAVTPERGFRSRSKERPEVAPVPTYDETLGIPPPRKSHEPEESDPAAEVPELAIRRTRQPQRLVKAALPTQEQLMKRQHLAESRWQTPLEHGQVHAYPGNLNRTMAPANPYQLTPSIPPSPTKTIPTPPRTSSKRPMDAAELLRASIVSPSVYSRDSAGNSPDRKASTTTINGPPGIAVIVSSHSAKSYTLGSSPDRSKAGKERSAQTSRDWKDWLSKEVADFEPTDDVDVSMSEEWLLRPGAGHRREHAQISEDDDDYRHRWIPKSRSTPAPRAVSQSDVRLSNGATPFPDLDLKPQQRPQLVKSPSTQMNDRFPIIQTGRKSSGTSWRTKSSSNYSFHASRQSSNPTLSQSREPLQPSIPEQYQAASLHTHAKENRPIRLRDVAVAGGKPSDISPKVATTQKPRPRTSHSSLAPYTTSAQETTTTMCSAPGTPPTGTSSSMSGAGAGATPTPPTPPPPAPPLPHFNHPPAKPTNINPLRFRAALASSASPSPSLSSAGAASPAKSQYGDATPTGFGRARSAFDLRAQNSNANMGLASANNASSGPSFRPQLSHSAAPGSSSSVTARLRRKPPPTSASMSTVAPGGPRLSMGSGGSCDTMAFIMRGPYGGGPGASATASASASIDAFDAERVERGGGVSEEGDDGWRGRNSLHHEGASGRSAGVCGFGAMPMPMPADHQQQHAQSTGSLRERRSLSRLGNGHGGATVPFGPNPLDHDRAPTPTPASFANVTGGQRLAERWLSARQVVGQQHGARSRDRGSTRSRTGSPAFM
ncbi:hypothetical protein HDK77DRAFT_514418 [Phyllosticta capitalensis]